MSESQHEFWVWFYANESKLFKLDGAHDHLFDELGDRLKIVDQDLTFELGPKRNDRRELVISAGGIKRAFQSVVDLVAAAPALDRWRLTAFRPRRAPMNVVDVGGKRVDPRGVQFSLLHNGTTSGIYMFIPNYTESDVDWKQIGYLLLDEALGEFDVETKVGLIKMLPPEAQTNGERYPLSDLPKRFDELISHLSEGHT